MKKLLLLLIVPALIAGGISAQLSTEGNQILYLNFEDDAELGYNDEDVGVTEEEGVIADEGKFGGGIYFDGDGDYMVFDLIEDWNHGMDFTLSWWMKSENTDLVWGIMGFGTYSGDIMTDFYDDEPRMGGMILVSEEGILNWEISWIGGLWPEEGNEPDPWTDGAWHHFAVVYDAEAETMRMYIDNVNYYVEEEPIATAADILVINDEEGTAASIEDDNFHLGAAGPGWLPEDEEQWPDNMFFEGFMDDVRLFNIPLTEEEVGEIYALTGINDVVSASLFNIYPNPASDIIQIQATGRKLAVNVYNIAGQVVLSSVNESSMNISSLSKGLYFIDVNVDGEREVQKLVIK